LKSLTQKDFEECRQKLAPADRAIRRSRRL
jgi:hypothetical protein